jgi:hypothetical protein
MTKPLASLPLRLQHAKQHTPILLLLVVARSGLDEIDRALGIDLEPLRRDAVLDQPTAHALGSSQRQRTIVFGRARASE